MKKIVLLSLSVVLFMPLFSQNNLAQVYSYGGVYVFNDCMPVSEYEVLGDVSFSNKGGFFKDPAQYTSVRNGLVSNAVLANREVEGIIIKLHGSGEGAATMIKFKSEAKDKSLAKVNSHGGILVFSDCLPVQPYEGMKKVKANAINVSSSYISLRDQLVRRGAKKNGTEGIIVNLVEGGRDTAETIKFTK